MFLPYADTPNVSDQRPWVNYAILAANVLVHVMWTAPKGVGIEYAAHIGAWGYTPSDPSFTTLFTSMFLHGDFAHLGGNMLFLWILGDNVEGRLGHVPYLLCYLGLGVAAVLGYALVTGPSIVPLVGASGAIYGVAGFYFLAFPRNRVRAIVFLRVALLPARLVLGMFVAFDVFRMFMASESAGGGVAYAAHVFGFVAGVLIAWAAARWIPEPAPALRRGGGRGVEVRSPSRVRYDRAVMHARVGRIEDAARDFSAVLHMAPGTELAGRSAFQLARIQTRVYGRPEDARPMLQLAASLVRDPQVLRQIAAELEEVG